MFCSKCGESIPEDSKFCSKCGESIPEDSKLSPKCGESIPEDSKLSTKCGHGLENKKLRTILLIAIGAMAVLLAVFCVLLFSGKLDSILIKNTNEDVNLESEDDSVDDTEAKDDVNDTAINEEINDEIVENTEPEEDPYILLKAVSIDLAPLKVNPEDEEGFIDELEVGRKLKWYGEEVWIEDSVFYKVTDAETDKTGYVSGKDVVQVYYEPLNEAGSIIETDTTSYTHEMMMKDIMELSSAYPDALSYRVMGLSYDGRQIYCLTLGNPNAPNRIMITAAIHGREYMTVQLVMKMIEFYLHNYDTGNYNGISYRELFDKVAFDIVPMSNPDGVTISQLGVEGLNNQEFVDVVYECYERDKYTLAYEIDSNGDGMWVDHWKEGGFNVLLSDNPTMISFGEYVRLWKANAYGVDLNCNFDAEWYPLESRAEPSYTNYKGPAPLSDVEATLLYSQALQHDYVCFLNYHSRGNLIYYSCAGASDEAIEGSEELAKLVASMNKYRPYNQDKASNVSLGGFGDWVMLSLNKPSIGIECGKRPCPLELDEFESMYLRNKEVWAMLACDYIK